MCNALENMDEPVQLGIELEEMLYRWRLYHSLPPRTCDEACELHKTHMCHLHPHLCQAMRCEDAALGHISSDTAIRFTRVCGNKNIDAALREDAAMGDTAAELQRTKEIWRLHSTLGDRQCSDRCQEFKKKTCTSNSMLCMEMRCVLTLLEHTHVQHPSSNAWLKFIQMVQQSRGFSCTSLHRAVADPATLSAATQLRKRVVASW